jgi:type I restriction enzyme S subunit
MNKEENKIAPKLRFPQFKKDGDWSIDKFSKFIKLYRGSSPRPISQFLTKEKDGVNWIKIGDTKNAIGYKISEVEEKITALGSKKSRKVKKGELILANSMSYGATYELKLNGCIYDGWFVLREFEDSFDKEFLLQLLNSDFLQTQYKRLAAGGIVQNISSEIVYNTLLPRFSIKEQQKIANCLSSLDDVINAETEKLDLLQDHKKGLLQQLFPQQGESQPKYRFPEFVGDGDWEETSLANCLDYLQPTAYLVDNTDYNDKYKTPVLTAGKTFILGYTNEDEGIFDSNLPVIIFDDFTTATKFVDFPFKVKSSAMKILLAKNDNNIKFIFEAIQNLKFEVSTHKRHWISVYSKLKILKPKDLKEQHKIADCLSSVDELIESQKQKIEGLKAHKKGLLQKLFPKVNSL